MFVVVCIVNAVALIAIAALIQNYKRQLYAARDACCTLAAYADACEQQCDIVQAERDRLAAELKEWKRYESFPTVWGTVKCSDN